MERKEFYEHCARLLDVQHEYHDPPPIPTSPRYDGTIRNTYKNRWNGRDPGNGRFPGRGIVRHCGAFIQVALRNPPLTGCYASVDDALIAIEQAIASEETP